MAKLLKCPHDTMMWSVSVNFKQTIVISEVINIKLSSVISFLTFSFTILYTEVGLGVERSLKRGLI